MRDVSERGVAFAFVRERTLGSLISCKLGVQAFGVGRCPRIEHNTSRLPGGSPEGGLGELLETATPCQKICRLDCLRLCGN